MKPAIAYGIAGSYFSDDWEIISITSEKTGRRGMIYGRDQHGAATHAKPEDVHGRFATREEATIGLEAIRRLHRQHAPGIDDVREQLLRLQAERNGAIKQALANIRVTKLA